MAINHTPQDTGTYRKLVHVSDLFNYDASGAIIPPYPWNSGVDYWKAGISYTTKDLVAHGGNIYINTGTSATVATAGNAPGVANSPWKVYYTNDSDELPWHHKTDYPAGTFVTYNKKIYVAKNQVGPVADTSTPALDGTNWVEYAQFIKDLDPIGWDPTETYALNQFASRNGELYISTAPNNTSNDPLTNTTAWTKYKPTVTVTPDSDMLKWLPNKYYGLGQFVSYQNKLYYNIDPAVGTARTQSVLNPVADTTRWAEYASGSGTSFVLEWNNTKAYAANEFVSYQKKLYYAVVTTGTTVQGGNDPSVNTTNWTEFKTKATASLNNTMTAPANSTNIGPIDFGSPIGNYNGVIVYHEGQRLTPTTDYTITGNTFTVLGPIGQHDIISWDLI